MPSRTNRIRRLLQMAKVGAITAAFMLGVGVVTGHAQDTAGTKGDSALSRRTDTTQSATQNDSAVGRSTTTHAATPAPPRSPTERRFPGFHQVGLSGGYQLQGAEPCRVSRDGAAGECPSCGLRR